MDQVVIRCPKCGWKPDDTSRWICICGYGWNPFETDGMCPNCGEDHRITQCLDCEKWSKFEDWFEKLHL